jgi:hypothetical protein
MDIYVGVCIIINEMNKFLPAVRKQEICMASGTVQNAQPWESHKKRGLCGSVVCI